MTSKSPLHPKEHSIYHTFKNSPWINSNYLIPRLCIIAMFLGWISLDCCLCLKVWTYIRKLKKVSELLELLNWMAIPLHTLLICGSGIDRLYLSHLVLFGIFEYIHVTMYSWGQGLNFETLDNHIHNFRTHGLHLLVHPDENSLLQNVQSCKRIFQYSCE